MRLDKYLKISRIIKRRTVANEACDAGRVTINGRQAKASADVKAGDIVEIKFGDKTTKLEVLEVKETVRKEDASGMYKIILAMLLAIVLAAQPLTAFADTYHRPAGEFPLLAAGLHTPAAAPSLLDFFPDFRPINLTREARAIALEDFDYLVNLMLQTAPTRLMFYRVFEISMEDYLDLLRQYIYNMVPIPSFTALFMCEDRWGNEPTDARMIAADYLMSLLVIMGFVDLLGFGHFIPQDLAMIEQTFFQSAHLMQDEGILVSLEEWRDEYPAWARGWDAALRFHQIKYEIYNRPSVLWFYGIDPSTFDFDVDLMDVIGFKDEDNLTTRIIEPGKIAYLHIESFMNNFAFDSEVLFPFFEEIQDFEHLIIDLRGNSGGWSSYFPSLIVSMLISEKLSFSYPEFFIANELTAALIENPLSIAAADLYGIFPAAEFVRSQGMTRFNRDDLALLDYVAVWNVVYYPSEYAIPFGGEIWLLVDEVSASASLMAAKIAVNTGFATVVGEPTSRVTGVVYTLAALPNTGILFRIDIGYTTDMYGRSIEEFGVIPDIANRPGMDALETVLAVIEESSEAALPVRYIGGVAFMHMRDVANALDVEVEWDGSNQAVIVTAADGSVLVVFVSAYGVINYGGRVYVPVENIEGIFGELVG